MCFVVAFLCGKMRDGMVLKKVFSFSQFSSPWSGEGEMAGTEAELLLKGLFFGLGKYPLYFRA